jgi:hypothetical protein
MFTVGLAPVQLECLGRHMSNDRQGGGCSLACDFAIAIFGYVFEDPHQRQEPFLVTRKTYTKPSTFVKYVIKFVNSTNFITNSKFAEQYAKNNKANQIF